MRRLAALTSCVVLAGCESPTSMLEPASSEASSLEWLWWALLIVTGVPALIYIAAGALAVWRRRGPDEPAPSAREATRVIVIAGALVPGVIVVIALAATLHVGAAVGEDASRQDAAITVEVVGHQFWWRVIYPDHGIETANEIHVPAGVPVRFRLTSADVIHSFWVPRLFGKRDMMPGHVTEHVVQIDAPGVYRGACYELCGVQHALMGFELVAHPPAEMDAWLAAQSRPAQVPGDVIARRGYEVYEAAECGHCHALRGISSPGASRAPGPDLTHLATRRTLGAATLPMSRGNLAGWILDPQPHKPGNRMPATPLAPDELHALLRFLEGLR